MGREHREYAHERAVYGYVHACGFDRHFDHQAYSEPSQFFLQTDNAPAQLFGPPQGTMNSQKATRRAGSAAAHGWSRPPTGQPRELNLNASAEISPARRRLSIPSFCCRSVRCPSPLQRGYGGQRRPDDSAVHRAYRASVGHCRC